MEEVGQIKTSGAIQLCPSDSILYLMATVGPGSGFGERPQFPAAKGKHSRKQTLNPDFLGAGGGGSVGFVFNTSSMWGEGLALTPSGLMLHANHLPMRGQGVTP